MGAAKEYNSSNEFAFRQFGRSKRVKELWSLTCLALSSLIWQERNVGLFEDKKSSKSM